MSEKTTDDNGLIGETVKEPSAIEVATKLHEQIKAENDRHEELLLRDEKVKATEVLGGKSEAGIVPEEVSKEQVIKDRVNKILEGTGRSI